MTEFHCFPVSPGVVLTKTIAPAALGGYCFKGHFMVFVLCRTGHLQAFFHHRNYSG